MLIAVGSGNMIKVDAVKEVFDHFYKNVRVMKVSINNQPLQPITLSGIVNGAMARASLALRKFNHAEFGVGIEAGLMEVPDINKYLNVQFAAIIDQNKKVTIGISPGFELAEDVMKMVLMERIELDKAVQHLYGIKDIGESRGIIDLMTKGAISRKELIANALIMAVAPRIGEKH